jgi:hypothetical protein
MDQLEILKKKWQSSQQEFPKLTSDDIYPMLLKRSSSLVKWIFIISIAELAFWIGLSFLVPESSKNINQAIGLAGIYKWITVMGYLVSLVFIYLFYVNYRRIQVTDSIKGLMKNILRTRRTVQYFVYYNIGGSFLLMLLANIYYYQHKSELYEVFSKYDETFASIPQEQFISVFFTSQIIAGLLILAVLLLFYWLIYGLLLRRLKRNYRELKKIEV